MKAQDKLLGEIDEVELKKQIAKYTVIFGILVIITAITFLQPLFITMDIKGLFPIQLFIATIKGGIILFTYMHLRESSLTTKIIVGCAGGALLVFLTLVGIDSNMDDSPNDMFQQSHETE